MLYEALDGVDAVVHLSSATVPSTSNLDPVADINGNLVNTVRLLEVMRGLSVNKLVYLSSGGTVYGVPEQEPVREDHPLRPISSYGIVKVAIENYLYMEHRLHGLSHVILRASNPYGPRQGHTGIQGVIGTYLWRISKNEPIEVWGDGNIVRDFIYVRDLAELCVRAVTCNVTGCFNAGSGEGASINDIVQHVGRAVGQEITPVKKPQRNYDVPRITLDIENAKREFDWHPSTNLEEGIQKTWEWIRSK
jgi:UDP-glucose 4-epimerase